MKLKHTLSSRQTFFAKVVSPAVWIGGVGVLTLWLLVASNTSRDRGIPLPAEVKWLLLALWLAGSAFALSSIRFKRVRMDEHTLHISNYLTEIEVPLADVTAVHENCWLRTHPVTIEFRRHTTFGDRVVFMPTVRWWRWSRWWAPHPVVPEIRSATDRVRHGGSRA